MGVRVILSCLGLLVSLPLPAKLSPERKQEVDTAIERGVRYIDSVRDTVPAPSAMFFYRYGRKFQISELLAFGKRAQAAFEALPAMDRNLPFKKLLDPSFTWPEVAVEKIPPTDGYMYSSLYCMDDLPAAMNLDPKQVEEIIEEGGYALTHVALALQWYKERCCEFPNGKALLEKAAQKMTEELEPLRFPNDLILEHLAFLYYFGKGSLVDDQWLQPVLDAQRADGGWGAKETSETSWWHSTGLAVFFLLEHTRPNPSVVPIFLMQN